MSDNKDMNNMINDFLSNGNVPDNVKEMLGNLKSNNQNNPANTNINEIDQEKISNIINMLKNNNTNNSTNNDNSIDMETLLKIKTIMDKMGNNQNDPRSNLLKSLKPYLKDTKKEKVEQYIKMLNMAKVMDVLKPDGSEDKK